jgi:exosortase
VGQNSDHIPAAHAGRYGLGDLVKLLNSFRLYWPIIIGGLIAVIPTLLSVAKESWSTEQGAHGPIVLATGLWLYWRRWPAARPYRMAGDTRIAALAALICAPIYIVSRIINIIELEGFFMYALLLSGTYWLIGWPALKKLWFPIVYMLFVFPPPDTVVAMITQPLKIGISQVAIDLLHACGYPIAGSGVTINIGQYQLLIAAACAGLNSLISLSAIGLFYIYVRHNANWRYAVLLMFAIVPVAVVANFIRVIVLILITYHMGDAAAQGFLHNFSGITMFLFSVLGIFGVDALASPLRQRLARR